MVKSGVRVYGLRREHCSYNGPSGWVGRLFFEHDRIQLAVELLKRRLGAAVDQPLVGVRGRRGAHVRAQVQAVVDLSVRVVEADAHDAVARPPVVHQLPVEQWHGQRRRRVEEQRLLHTVHVGQRARPVRAGHDQVAAVVAARRVVVQPLSRVRLQVGPHVPVEDLPLRRHVRVVEPAQVIIKKKKKKLKKISTVGIFKCIF